MHPLLKLMMTNRHKGNFKIVDKTADTNETTIYLYDMIVNTDEEAEWSGGIAPKAFILALNAIDAAVIHLRVNSPGGAVFAARAMEQAIREHKSKIVAHVDGVAASAASFLITAADEVVMSPSAFLMIHNAVNIAYGSAAELRKEAALLEKVDTSLVKSYAVKSAQSETDIQNWMSQETWFNAEEAVALGFADRVAAEKSPEAKTQVALATWDLSAFSRAPAAIQPPPAPAPASPPASVSVAVTPPALTVDRDALIRQAAVAACLSV